MIKNTLYFLGSILIFFTGTLVYGVILNSSERPLDEIMKEKGVKDYSKIIIVVHKQKYRLELYSDTTFIKSYRAVFGRNSTIPKILKNKKTLPAGKYKVCEVDVASRYRKFFRLNYPRLSELKDAVKENVISLADYNNIYNYKKTDECYFNSSLDNVKIGIHGIGELDFIFRNLPFVYNWTNGSIAVSNNAIDEIYSVTNVGTEVVIKN